MAAPPRPHPPADLSAEFDLRELRFEHAGLRLDLLAPREVEALIDEEAFARDEQLPYWADLWPSARALARQLLERPSLPARALELGCGLGLCSLVLAARGVAVLATDLDPAALCFVRENARRNGLEGVTTQVLDWRAIPTDLERYPLVVAADVVYEPRLAAPLAEAIGCGLEPAGQVLIADPRRRPFAELRERLRGTGLAERGRSERSEPNGAAAVVVALHELALPPG